MECLAQEASSAENFESEIVEFFKTGNRSSQEFCICVIEKKFLDKHNAN